MVEFVFESRTFREERADAEQPIDPCSAHHQRIISHEILRIIGTVALLQQKRERHEKFH